MRIIAFEVGPGKVSVLRKLINKIEGKIVCPDSVCTDRNFSYEEELDRNADILHVASKLSSPGL